MGFQFLSLFSGQSASISHLAVPFDIPHRTHSHYDGGYGRMTQHITQRRFGHLIQSDVEIRSDLLDAFIDLLLSVAPEVIASKITLFKSAIWCDFTSQTSFIQCHPYNDANMMKFTCGKQLVFPSRATPS